MFRGTRWRRSLIQCAASCRTRILRPLIYLGPTPDLNVGKYLAKADFSLSTKRFVMVRSSLQVCIVGELVLGAPDWKYGVPKFLCSRVSLCVCLLTCFSPKQLYNICQNKIVNCGFDSFDNKIRILETSSLPELSSILSRLFEWTLPLHWEDV